MEMKNTSEKWALAMEIAKKLGVNAIAIAKWKHRSVIPSRWHLPIIIESGGALGASDFIGKKEHKEEVANVVVD